MIYDMESNSADSEYHVVGGEDHVVVELILDQLESQVPPLVLGAPVGHHLYTWRPQLQLLPPVVHGGAGDDYKVRTLLARLLEVSQKCDGLDGLPQPHLVSQDTVQRLLVHQHQPI